MCITIQVILQEGEQFKRKGSECEEYEEQKKFVGFY